MSCRVVSRQVSVGARVLDEAIQATRTAAALITVRRIDCNRSRLPQACKKELYLEWVGRPAPSRCVLEVHRRLLVPDVVSPITIQRRGAYCRSTGRRPG